MGGQKTKEQQYYIYDYYSHFQQEKKMLRATLQSCDQ